LLSHGHGQAAEKPPAPPTAEELLANGPKFFDVRPLNTYPVYGFVRDGWSIVVDYSSALDAETVLRVTVGDHAWSRRLEPGPHQTVVRFDGGFSPDPSVALLSVETVARTSAGVEPIQVYGIAAGPGASGALGYAPNLSLALAVADSVGRAPADPAFRPVRVYRIAAAEGAADALPIDILAFGPPVLEGGKGAATFSYRRNMPLEKISPEIVRTTRTDKALRSEIVWRDEVERHQFPGLSGDRTWDGRELGDGKISRGLHSLQVRVWQQAPTEPAWGGASSRQTIQVR
jgi:hypothetical protein